MKKFTFLSFLLVAAFHAVGQMPTDGLMMKKNEWCTLLQYSRSSFDEYWEGETKRDNPNLGTIFNENIMLMSAFGITDKLNVMAALPYVRTGTSDSYLEGQKGIQDVSAWLKYQAFYKKLKSGEFKVQLAGGASTPTHSYIPDFLPLSIGFSCKTASLRAVLNYTHRTGIYLTAQSGHTWRSNAKLDRNSFTLNGEVVHSDKAPVPNVWDATARLGFINRRIQAEVWCDYFTGLSGDDILYNDMPMLTNKMQAMSAGLFAKYHFGKIAVQAGAGQVLQGRNVGQGTTISAGFTYLFKI